MCGARWCDHRPSSGDHPVVIVECEENPRVRQKCRWGAFLALVGHQHVCGTHPCDHMSGDDDHSVMITEYVETL